MKKNAKDFVTSAKDMDISSDTVLRKPLNHPRK
jgi:hypothetical protein